ncbi:hypothetical protein MASR2M117_25940 [Paludibacter sp.]
MSASIGLSGGSSFVFKNGYEDWSEPLVVDLYAIKGKASIPVSIRVKYAKTVILACHYLCEITNLSESQSVKFGLGTGYTDYKGKDVITKYSLKPKAIVEGKIIYAYGMKKPKSPEDCVCNWSPQLKFFNTKIK